MSEIKGNIIHIGETETVGSAGTFKKRQVVVETEEQYKQQIPVDFVQDKTSLLDQFQVGNEVTVSINIRGNEYNGKYYVNLNGWKISKVTNAAPQSAVEGYNMQTTSMDDDSQDLPF